MKLAEIIKAKIDRCDSGRRHEAELEMKVAVEAVKGLIAAGYTVSVDNGEEEFKHTNSVEEVTKELFECDEEHLVVYKEGKRSGWVFLVWGNGACVICDYSTNLEAALKKANELADYYCG